MWHETPTLTLSNQRSFHSKRTEKNSQPKAEISERETEVLQLMANGKSTKQIADALYISIDTVESHRKSLYKKLKVGNASEAVAWGFRNKVIR